MTTEQPKEIKFPFVFRQFITVDYDNTNDENKLVIQLSDNKVIDEYFKDTPPNKKQREITLAFLDLFKELSHSSPFEFTNYIYNFIVTTSLVDQYINMMHGVNINKVIIDLNNYYMQMYNILNLSIPTLILKFSEIDNEFVCTRVILNISNNKYSSRYFGRDKGNYICREMIIENSIIRENTYSINENRSEFTFVEFADYNHYLTYKTIRQNIKYATEAFIDGKTLTTICKLDPEYIYRYTAICENTENSYVYKGTYTFTKNGSKPETYLNLARVYRENPYNKMNSIDRYPIYSAYNIHNLLFTDSKGERGFIHLASFPNNVKLISETIEYSSDFYKQNNIRLQELPSSKNYYYMDNSILEISFSELPGKGKQLKKTNQYYKLLQVDEDGTESLYVIKPNLENLNDAIYEIIDSKDSMEDNEIISKVENSIQEACNSLGIQYR